MNGTSWADQWDNSAKGGRIGGGAVVGSSGGGATSNTAKYKEKLGQGLGKTKAVASSGFKKLKTGSALGFRWVKDKYHKTTNKH
ncbi:unnamed protein product [Eruca vesicaria subsp. sativa]|uniref:CDP-diacylglycerol-glycerol-3-phosphate 3-phosphatidyltransferase n=1 Tax=Eruca vesicaria subsp. sativa TaxID=29727 RepID=A0ABC8M5M5_ERUVS|nr:unnamed protein product [Eruca vesicaria subsp. sativa]